VEQPKNLAKSVTVEEGICIMQRSIEPQSKEPGYEAWLRSQVETGIADADAGDVIPAEEIEAEFAALRRAAMFAANGLAI
jgi:predicted transcriptional regulator